MTEKELLEQLKKDAGQVTPPESLHPENIEKMLENLPRKTAPGTKPKKKPSIYRLGGLAAVFAVAVIGFWQTGHLSNRPDPIPSESSQKNAGQEESSAPKNEDTAENAAISKTEGAAENTAAAETSGIAEDAAVPEDTLPTAGSYEAVYQALYERFCSTPYDEDAYGEMEDVVFDAEGTARSAVSAADTGAGQFAGISEKDADASYSSTNVQEQGVDEGDLVKTDGSYLYILKRSGSLIIVDAADGSKMSAAAVLPLSLSEQPQEMYVDGDILCVITSEYFTEIDDSEDDIIASRSGTRTKLYTYQISDRKNPVLSGTVTQDGSFSQSRKNGSYIYLFSLFQPVLQDTYEDSQLIPKTSSGQISPDDVYLPRQLSCSSYLVVSSIDIRNPGEIKNQKAVVSVPSTFYVSRENIYIANENWNGNSPCTDLLKLHYADGIITGTAAGSLEGYLNDSFSLSEYNGYLRAVTTGYDENYQEINGLYILDQDLKLAGAIRDLAPNETIRSARFLGDTGYFVTFRQTDPLFSVDLSDPAQPKILGSLKISGFSAYLHFYSDTLLLGLGYEADESTGIRTGLKLSMFDISDPSDVKEVHKLVLDGITYCSSLDNYRSILLDPEKNIFGFTCDNRYLAFSYDAEKGFVKEFLYDFYQDLLREGLSQAGSSPEENGTAAADTDVSDGSFSDSDTRGLYINDTLYLVRPDGISSFDMSSGYQNLGYLSLKK